MINYSSKTKQGLIAGLSLLLLLTLYWAFCTRSRYEALQAMPSQTAAAFVFSGLDHFEKVMQDAPAGLSGLSLLQVCRKDLVQALDVFRADSILQNALRHGSLTAGLSLQPTDSLHTVFVLDLAESFKAAPVLDRIARDYKIFPAEFKGATIYTILLPNRERLVLAVQKNLLLFSRYSFLVEDALLQLKERDQWWAKQTAPPKNTTPGFRILLRPEILAARLEGSLLAAGAGLPDWLSRNFQQLEIYQSGAQWLFRTQTTSPLRLSPSAAAVPDSIFSVLPDHTALMLWLNFAEQASFQGLLPDAAASRDFRQFVAPWAGKELAWVLTDPYTPDLKEDQFLVGSVQNEALAQQKLTEFGNQTGLLKQYDYQTFEIRQFLSNALIAPFLGKDRQIFQNPVCALLNGYIVFAATPSAMELWIDKYVVSQTMRNLPEFQLIKQDLPQKGNSMLVFNASYLNALAGRMLTPSFLQEFGGDISRLQGSGLFGLSMRMDPQGGIQGAWSNHAPVAQSAQASILWKLSLGAPALTAPALIPSENPDNEAAILIQDAQLMLYRISARGNVLWRKQLDQPILSAIQGIDFYQNNSTCYLFNTADAIWLLDDEGNELVGYPLHLQSPASNGVTVVDFDGNKKYSLFIACMNGNLYGFDQFGRPLAGWNPKSGTGRVKHGLIHFKSSTKDYLAVLSLSGMLSVFNRNGTPHFAPLQFDGSFFLNPPQFDAGPESPRIVCMNAGGRAYISNLSGQTFTMEMGGNRPGAETCFAMEQLFGDARKDYAVLQGNALVLFGYENQSFRKWHSLSFPSPQDTLFKTGERAQLGTLNREKRQIFLVNGQGEIHSGFPLAGTTPFCISSTVVNQHDYMLVVGNGSDVYAYKVR